MPSRFQGRTKPVRKRQRAIRPIVRYEPDIDDFRRYVTDDPTPEKMAILLRSVDDGDIAALVEMTEEMIAKDPHLRGVAKKRRGALTQLDWDVEPNPDDPDPELANAKADFCRKRLNDIKNFQDVISHLSEAIGPNVAVVELLWDRFELVGMVPVPGHRLLGDQSGRLPGVFVETVDHPLGVQTKPGKWIVHHPDPNGGFPFRSTLTHSTVWPWLMIHFGRLDWMAFSELYGQPIRIANYNDEVGDDDRKELQQMLERMGSGTAGSFPEGVTVELLQASGDGKMFGDQLGYAERKIDVAWLGQTLTTDVGQSGSGAYALGKIHEGVREDIRAMDLQAEKQTMECQLLTPMVGLQFPDEPKGGNFTPLWTRSVEEKRQLEEEKIDMERLVAAREMGLPLKREQAYKLLGLDEPAETDAVIGGTPQTGVSDDNGNTSPGT